MADGRVTIVAHNATPRQVLEEWARQGHTRIVNVERVMGAPDTFELKDVPESRALATLLRSVAGYIAAPRPTPMANASMFDRILILPTSVAAPAPGMMRPAAAQPAKPTIFEVPPDPSALANEDGNDTAPVFQGNADPNAVTPPMGPLPPGATPPTPALSPYNPPGDATSQTGQTPAPITSPSAGQFIAPGPGVLPTQQPQQPPK